MDYNAQLRLQALLDGELPEAEAKQVTAWVARDGEAAALLEELRNARGALAGFEDGIRLPESREFFWSKIEREIQRLESPAPKAVREPYGTWWRRFLVPACAVALALLGAFVLTQPGRPGRTAAADTETVLADAGAFTYRDYSAGATLVWLSYPADHEAANNDETSAFE